MLTAEQKAFILKNEKEIQDFLYADQRKRREDAWAQRDAALKSAGYDFDIFFVGTWYCPDSPVGVCIYNDEEDPAWDECVVCGQPDERK